MDVPTLRDAQAGRLSIARVLDVRGLLSLAVREAPTLVRRLPDSTSSGSSATTTCSKSKDSDTCQKPVDNTALPIALGVAVPLVCALLAFVYFHRRYKKKLRAEDAADEEKYKSMDFGMDLHYEGKKKRKGKNDQHQMDPNVYRNPHGRGLSLEDNESPYFFRGGVRNSMESLRSLGNSIRHHQDPYNAHLGGKAADNLSIRCPSPRVRQFTESSTATSAYEGYSHLLSHAQGSPRSEIPRTDSLPSPPDLPSTVRIQEPEKAMLAANEHASARVIAGAMLPTSQDPLQAPHSYYESFGTSNRHLGNPTESTEQSGKFQAVGGAQMESENDKTKVDSATSTLLGSVASNKDMFSHVEHCPPEVPPARVLQPKTADTSASPPLQTHHVTSNTVEQHYTSDKFNSIQGSVYDAGHLSYGQPYERQSNMGDFHGQNASDEAAVNVRAPGPLQPSENLEQPGIDQRTSHVSQESRSSYGDNNHPSRGQSLAAPLPEIREHVEPYPGSYPDQTYGHDAFGSTAHDVYNDDANFYDPHTYSAEEYPVNPYDSHGYNGADYYDETTYDAGLDTLGYDPSRVSVFMRPLPPDDPTEDPEARANRIRSFYKEYFDESKTGQYPGQPRYTQHQQRGRAGYYEEYDSEYLGNGYSVYDERSGGFIVGGAPYAQPITRRAMTPPPRAPPRHFRGRPGGHNSASLRSPLSASGSTVSGYMTPPRAGSSMSNYSRVRPLKKNLPPPASLISLRTPALLKDDSALYGAFDLAPPPTFRQRQNGMRPDSPLGTERPYSPGVRVHTPLQSSFDELSPMPSPHLLRKSGTFTALDFAPVPRFRGVDTGSDAGSIRSGRSGMSNGQLHAMRAGAHRLSRIPKELAGTKDDITASLRPKWDMKY